MIEDEQSDHQILSLKIKMVEAREKLGLQKHEPEDN